MREAVIRSDSSEPSPPLKNCSVMGEVKSDIYPQYYTQPTFYDTFSVCPDYESILKTRTSNLRKCEKQIFYKLIPARPNPLACCP